uniref:Uncharacterized protein n=1 Tax=Strigamia maritima TaxID=126957 RepID=T1IUG5_STRMM
MLSSRGTSKYVLRSHNRRKIVVANAKTNKFEFLRLYSDIRGYVRVFWLICCLLSCGVCIFQLEDRFRFYFSNPTISRVSITQSDTGHFPPVTLCPSNLNDDFEYFLNEKMIEQYMNLLKTESNQLKDSSVLDLTFDELNMSLAEVWEKYALDTEHEQNSISCAGLIDKTLCNDKNSPHPVANSNISTMLGKCYSYIMIEEVEYHGASTYWKFQYGKQNFLNSRVHSDSDGEMKFIIADLTPNIIHEAFYSGIQLFLNHHTDVYINSKEFVFLNLEHRPCKDWKTIFNCRSQCLNKKLEAKLNCILPFINSTILEPCTDFNSSVNAYTIAFFTYISHSHRDCKCLPMCTEITYNSWIDVLPKKLKNQSLPLSLFISLIITKKL